MGVILLKHILLEMMTVDDANAIFLQHGIPNASSMNKTELKAVYRDLFIQNHPDKGGSHEDIWELSAAYDTLKNTSSQTTYPAPSTSDPYYGRTMPKTASNKHALKPVHIEFRFEDNNEELATGIYDLYSLSQVVKVLKETMKMDVSYDPLIPFDNKTRQWLSNKIIVYVNVVGKNPWARQFIKKSIVKLNQKYSEIKL